MYKRQIVQPTQDGGSKVDPNYTALIKARELELKYIRLLGLTPVDRMKLAKETATPEEVKEHGMDVLEMFDESGERIKAGILVPKDNKDE